MSAHHLLTRHVWLFAANTMSHALRGGSGILFFIGTLLTGLIIASIVLSPIDMLADQSRKQGQEMTQPQLMAGLIGYAKPVVTWCLGGRSPVGDDDGSAETPKQQDARKWTNYLLDRHPAPLSAIYLLLAYALPFLIACGAFNQTAGDAQARRLRFLLPRTQRGNIYLGRALGTLAFVALSIAIVMAIIGAYVAVKVSLYSPVSIVTWTLHCWVALVLIAMPYVALCAGISASLSSSIGSLTLVSTIVGMVPLIATLAAMSYPVCRYLNYLLPLPFQYHLFHFSWLHAALAGLACLTYSAVYGAFGWWQFHRRDL